MAVEDLLCLCVCVTVDKVADEAKSSALLVTVYFRQMYIY
jgi:hypothetical protein